MNLFVPIVWIGVVAFLVWHWRLQTKLMNKAKEDMKLARDKMEYYYSQMTPKELEALREDERKFQEWRKNKYKEKTDE